jgi:hypothetical protein
MYACTIGADIDRTLPVWQPRAVRPAVEPEPAPTPAPEQAQGPGKRRAGASGDDVADPLAQLAKDLGAPPVPGTGAD